MERTPAPANLGLPSRIERLITNINDRGVVQAESTTGVATTAANVSTSDELSAAPWDEVKLPSQPPRGAMLERGSLVGRFIVLHPLGQGGMGMVYAAHDPELDRQIALKLVLPGQRSESNRARLFQEAQALAKLSHTNVVGIYDVGTVDHQLWLAMELVRGEPLGAWLGRKTRSWREVLHVMQGAGQGLAAAHAAGLLHRDFKPDNVMVNANQHAKVMDFGLARAPHSSDTSTNPLARVTLPGMWVGTPAYMAPEQFGDEQPSFAADQFSLCVTLWEALYDERPFQGKTMGELMGSLCTERPRAPQNTRHVPRWLKKVCLRGLSADPEQRFPSVKALLSALARGQRRMWIRRAAATLGAIAALGSTPGVEASEHEPEDESAIFGPTESAIQAACPRTSTVTRVPLPMRQAKRLALEHLAEARFELARALWATPAAQGGDSYRAITLARRARDHYRILGEPKASQLAEVEAWLRTHGASS